MPHALPALPYAFDALEPHIDAKTMEIHHSKHHQTYVTSLNTAVQGTPYQDTPAEALIVAIDELPEALRPPVRNHLMHWGTGALVGALRGVWSASGLRGWRASSSRRGIRCPTRSSAIPSSATPSSRC